ncbi:replicative DNA helicase [Pediococcus acidilactici]|uniref:replicative DNA helicase n=1 Tax=Pediococcus acidilactici TaxID=1254 RepID=UPI001330916D|nr:DnaB-like helicase C-terminal domain-containing protein [Pediococcus acidilactici]KAF0359471.1 DNA helicase [Pediococcus acidilactici]KAF0378418.1 DNA helicase [Pediococcus acidilactici]KAF0437611.1 DNA helicase [Pediococcus acidilactici]KAF0529603.1 DNA helicase [Pediococcus acidilactici]KAF0542374.1 DNA helicase [Pediococcus acidilactici]
MNTDIERGVIGSLLNHPEKVGAVALNEEWFGYEDYRLIYKAIKETTGHDILDVYGKYNQLTKKAMDFRTFKQIVDEAPAASQLNNDINLMRKLAYKRELSIAIKDYQANPFSENEERIREILAKNQTLEATDDGKLDEAAAELADALIHPKPRGIKTFTQLDKSLGGGLYGSMLLTIGARPSTGKTAFSVNLAYQAMKNDKEVEVDFFTLEMNKQEMLNRFVSRMTGVSSSTLRSNADKLNGILKKLVNQSTSQLLASKLRVYDGLETLGEIVQTIRKNASRAKQGKYMAIIDYIGLVKVPNVKERYIEVGEVTRELKRLTNEFNIPIVALSQLSRGIENRNDKTPVLSDLRESGSIEQDSNVVAFLHRPESVNDDHVVQLSIRKNREGELADINFTFIGEEMTFKEVAI